MNFLSMHLLMFKYFMFSPPGDIIPLLQILGVMVKIFDLLFFESIPVQNNRIGDPEEGLLFVSDQVDFILDLVYHFACHLSANAPVDFLIHQENRFLNISHK